MKFCYECGNKLILKECNNDGLIPFCNYCNEYRFPIFSTAVSMVVLSPNRDKTLFIQQYDKGRNWLVAGYVNKGETAEEAVKRELFEEVGLTIKKMWFQKSQYWPRSNALLFNYVVVVDSMDVITNNEVDRYEWFDLEEAYRCVASGGLAEVFYKMFYERYKNEV